MAGSRDRECADVLFKKDTCNIIVKQGDLFQETDVDAIVIPTPEGGAQSSHTYPLFERLYSDAGQNLKGQLKRLGAKIKLGDEPQIIQTEKPAIILTATPFRGNERKAAQLLQNTYLSCLRFASDNQCQTIAFPSIGCGQSGFPASDAAAHLYKALLQFEPARNKQLTEIRMVIYQKSIFSEFVNRFMNDCLEKNSKIKHTEILTKLSTPSHVSLGVRLNPETPEFRPTTGVRDRPTRRYRLKNNRTELLIAQGDILKAKVDAIVNAANESMLGGGGVDGIIHQAAGKELLQACRAHKEIYYDIRLPTGRSRILLSYKLKSTVHYIINTAGPRYDKRQAQDCEEKLISCYETSLKLANLYDLETIAFTAISCGVFEYPLDEGADVALRTVNTNADNIREVRFLLKDDDIYDVWVKKAEELQLLSLDGSSPQVTSAPTTPTTKSEASAVVETCEKRNPIDIRVIDASGTDSSEKMGEPASEDSLEKSTSGTDEGDDRRKDEGEEEKTGAESTRKSSKKKDSDRKKEVVEGEGGQQNPVKARNQNPQTSPTANKTKGSSGSHHNRKK